MSWRTVIISNRAKLDYKMGLMVVRGEETKRVVLDEIATLVIENPAVSLTGCLLEILVEKKVKIIFCDSKRSPVAELVPHHGSHDSALKIRTQAAWSDEVKGMIWAEIISEKIRKQAEFLEELGKERESVLLKSYIGQIEELDASNREGHAAKVYFNALFGMDFTRGAVNAANAALNYGYSLILSTFNREVSANGYLTQLGIFHNNMFNHFNLSCDLMEPFRIVVDRFVVKNGMGDLLSFEKENKHELWSLLEERVLVEGSRRSVSDAIRVYSKSVFDAINDGDPSEIKFFDFIKEREKIEFDY